MVNGKKIVVVLPAYNAEKTLAQTVSQIPPGVADEIIAVDDASDDETVKVARSLGLTVHQHAMNRGYGANQKTCYDLALAAGADVVVMLHPDYQYTPRLLPSMSALIVNDVYDVVLGSRILGNGALRGGMPIYKYVANRALTFFQNICTGAKLSEYHTGYRAFSKSALQTIAYHKFSDSHIFDNEMLSEVILAGFSIGEMSCPTHYFPEASSLNFVKSMAYGLGVLRVSTVHLVKRFFSRPSQN